jgi:ABC-type sugar transport system ATPase subunit
LRHVSDVAAVSLLSIKRLSKTYGGVAALRDASLEVEAGEAHALVGENGAGKSTLIKILAGAVRADAVEITVNGRPVSISSTRDAHRLGLRFLHQELNVLPRLSVAENLFLGLSYPTRFAGLIDWPALHERARGALAGLEAAHIAPKTILGRLPKGDQMIVKIASTFLEDASGSGRLFVMDEPTAALSSEEAERLFRIVGELKRRGGAIIYVSHRIDEVLRISDRVTVLRDGASEAPIPTNRATRALLIERMTGRTSLEGAAVARIPSQALVALAVRGMTGNGLVDVSFEVRKGEILGVAGLGDGGGDRLLKCLMGGARGGDISIMGRRTRVRSPAEAWRQGLAFVPGERRSEGLFLSQDILRNVTLPHLRRLARLSAFANRPAELAEVATVGRRVRLRATGPRQRVWRLSGGNQQKVMFGRAVAGAPRVLLLDEPTRGVDIAAKFDIHALLREIADAGAAILITSSDHEELLELCTRIMILKDRRISGIVPALGLTPAELLALCYGGRTE